MRAPNAVRSGLVILVVSMSALFVPAAGAQIVVGQVSPTVPTESSCTIGFPFDEVQVAVQGGTSYAAPAAGVLTSWSVNEGPGSGSLGMKVFRPLGGGAYLVVGHDGPRPLTSNSLNTFPISIPVQAGDLVGTALPANSAVSCVFFTGLAGDVTGFREGLAGDGQSISPEGTELEFRLNVSAMLLPPPVINAITPSNASIKGASVVIGGANFASVSAVSFGSVPAAGFTIDSEGQITAVAPASKTLASVPVTVTTVAGTATSALPFTYEGCKVPQLKGKKLKAAKKKLANAKCSLGKVKKLHGATAKTGKVVKQAPKPGTILAPRSKVKITLDL